MRLVSFSEQHFVETCFLKTVAFTMLPRRVSQLWQKLGKIWEWPGNEANTKRELEHVVLIKMCEMLPFYSENICRFPITSCSHEKTYHFSIPQARESRAGPGHEATSSNWPRFYQAFATAKT